MVIDTELSIKVKENLVAIRKTSSLTQVLGHYYVFETLRHGLAVKVKSQPSCFGKGVIKGQVFLVVKTCKTVRQSEKLLSRLPHRKGRNSSTSRRSREEASLGSGWQGKGGVT